MRKLRCSLNAAWWAGQVSPALAWPGGSLNTGHLLRVESDEFDAYADSQTIAQWTDQSPNLNHFTAIDASWQPWASQTVKLNGHASVRFTLSGAKERHLRRLAAWNGDPGLWTEAEILAIMIVDNDPATGDLGAPFKFGNSSGTDSHVPLNDGNVYENFGDAARPNSGNPTTSFASWVGYNVRADSGGNRKIVVGSEVLENSAGHTWTAPKPGSAVTIGDSWAGNYTPPTYAHRAMDGNLAAVYFWDRILTAGEHATLSAYILAKWGVTIPTS
jgi:hypothetical protein